MIGILGGTFDPVHHGHLRLALEIQQRLHLERVCLLPCSQPPHRKEPGASAAQRAQMLALAVEDEPALCVDGRELRRSGPSYMVDTLSELRAEQETEPLALILGMDAFLGLHTWHRWEVLIQLAHFIVVRRPAAPFSPSPAIQRLLQKHQIKDTTQLHGQAAGCIALLEVPALDISATAVRKLLKNQLSPRYLLPPKVLDFIREQGLYRSSG